MNLVPKKIRCINTKTNRVKYISENITKKSFFSKEGWMVQELEEGEEEEQSIQTKKQPQQTGKLIDLGKPGRNEQSNSETQKEEEESEEVKKQEQELEEEQEQENQDELNAEQFKANLVSIKGIGSRSADDIIEVYENETNLMEAVKGNEELPFTADIVKALERAYK